MTISISEGQTHAVHAGHTLAYPGINSCLALTTVMPDKKRFGGHAVLILGPGQQQLQLICDFLMAGGDGEMLYIIGDIGVWDQNWKGLQQCKDLRINNQAVNSVAGIATALGYADNHVIFDINDWLEEDEAGTFNIYFGYDADNNRKLWAINTATAEECSVPGHDTW